jgi:hypothetical protein
VRWIRARRRRLRIEIGYSILSELEPKILEFYTR